MRTLTLLTALLVAALIAGVGLLAAAPPTTPATALTATDPTSEGPSPSATDGGVVAVAAARTQLGVPYQWGAATPGTAFDCSGLTQLAWRQAGITLPRTTTEQLGAGVEVSIDDLQEGDLVFTRGGRPARDYGHVALYAGNDTLIVAPHTGADVRLQPLQPHRVQAIRRPTNTLTPRNPTNRG